MKIKLSTPFWIMVSAVIGLVTLFWSSTSLYNLTIPQSSAIVHFTEGASFNEIKININKSNRVDTIFYNSDFVNKLTANKNKQSLTNWLPQIPTKGYLNINPKVFRWIIFHSVALSLCVASLPFMLYLVFHSFNKSRKCLGFFESLALVIGIIVVIISLYFIEKPQLKLINGVELMRYFNLNFSNPEYATKIILIPMFIVSLVPIIGIMLCNYRAYCTFENKIEESPTSPPLDKGNEYAEINTIINIFAFYLGLLISCAVLGCGLQRDMIINQIGEQLYPKEILYAYGIAFSVILALFFIPSFVYLRFVGRGYQSKVTDGPIWKIGQETIENLRLALSISLPLITSIVQPIISSN